MVAEKRAQSIVICISDFWEVNERSYSCHTQYNASNT